MHIVYCIFHSYVARMAALIIYPWTVLRGIFERLASLAFTEESAATGFQKG